MDIFLSWSKIRAKAVANIFRGWIPDVLQAARPWMSDHDIESGITWNQQIRGRLHVANYGILFLTRENLTEPWLMFEAGALAKNFETARVCPFIVDDGLEFELLPSPLSQFQARKYDKRGTWLLISDISLAMENTLPKDRLERSFEAHWPRLVDELKGAPAANGEVPKLETDEMLRKIYAAVQRAERRSESRIPQVEGRPSRRKSSPLLRDFVMKSRDSFFDRDLLTAAANELTRQIEVELKDKHGLDLDESTAYQIFSRVRESVLDHAEIGFSFPVPDGRVNIHMDPSGSFSIDKTPNAAS